MLHVIILMTNFKITFNVFFVYVRIYVYIFKIISRLYMTLWFVIISLSFYKKSNIDYYIISLYKSILYIYHIIHFTL